MMKLTLVISLAAGASAFAPSSTGRPSFVLRSTAEETKSESKPFFADDSGSSSGSSDFASAVPEKPDIYAQLGWKEEDVSVGIKPEDILEYIGTRDDLIAKFQKDNKSFDAERAASEADKFILDPEMVDLMIEYNKRQRNKTPSDLKAEAEQTLTDPSTWATYGLWIAGGAGFASLKNMYVEPKFASGEWNDIVINLPHPDWLMHSPAADTTVSAVGDAISHTVDPAGVQSVVEGVSGAVSDALTKCVGESCT